MESCCFGSLLPELHLWRNDDSLAVPLYERMGFVLTGKVEEPE